jgi:hypothetical protein
MESARHRRPNPVALWRLDRVKLSGADLSAVRAAVKAGRNVSTTLIQLFG